jgi:hypothetical protein
MMQASPHLLSIAWAGLSRKPDAGIHNSCHNINFLSVNIVTPKRSVFYGRVVLPKTVGGALRLFIPQNGAVPSF